MRRFLISAALLGSTVALAAPAAAQWAPPMPQGYAYGYNHNSGQVRRLEVRVQQLRREIRQLDRRNILSNREANRLDAEARSLQYRLRQLGYNGLSPRERYEIQRRIARLEQNIRYQANDGDRRYANYGEWGDRDRDGVNDRYDNRIDRDRDGRDDRWENDRRRDHDDREDHDDDD